MVAPSSTVKKHLESFSTSQKFLIKSNASDMFMHIYCLEEIIGIKCTDQESGYWYIDELGHGKICIRSALTNSYLAVKNFGLKDGTPLILQQSLQENCHFKKIENGLGIYNIVSCISNRCVNLHAPDKDQKTCLIHIYGDDKPFTREWSVNKWVLIPNTGMIKSVQWSLQELYHVKGGSHGTAEHELKMTTGKRSFKKFNVNIEAKASWKFIPKVLEADIKAGFAGLWQYANQEEQVETKKVIIHFDKPCYFYQVLADVNYADG